ncbi:MAG: magnesium chelatase, partial [Actinomycetota bacterium]|nr:magnesium chelatase [Actinomycetota bacterium]
GKIEFESGEEGRELEILEHLMRKSVADTVRAHLGGIDMAPLVEALESSEPVVTGDRVTAHDFLASIPDPDTTAGVLDEIADRLEAESEGERASAVELALEGLFLARRIGKEADESGQTIYG